jgi:hypothetical protein
MSDFSHQKQAQKKTGLRKKVGLHTNNGYFSAEISTQEKHIVGTT